MSENKALKKRDALSRGPMMRELARWNRFALAPPGRPRWSEWARSLIERHWLATARRGAEAMTFARPAILTRLLHERRIISTFQLFPKINLSIQPILRETIYRERERFQMYREYRPFAPQNPSPDGGRAGDYISGSPVTDRTVPAVQRILAIERSIELIRNSGKRAASPGEKDRDASSTGDFQPDARISRSPMQLAFQRFEAGDDYLQSRRGYERIQRNVEALAFRVARRAQREERKPEVPPTMIARQSSPAIQSTSSETAIERRQASLPDTIDLQTFPRRGAAQSLDLNVEQITERVLREIDHRATAWRERMGKF